MITHLQRYTFPAAFALLPPKMDSLPARAMLLAIALQESGCCARRQKGRGPARSFYQFEEGGLRGVMKHPSSRQFAATALRALEYHDFTARVVLTAMEHNDTLATVMARLLLWTDPKMLPLADEAPKGWAMYLRTWRPGKPRPNEWPEHFADAWAVVSA